MSFTLRATMLNIALVALFLGAWVTLSGIYIAIAACVFLVLILLSVANSILDENHRPYWTGAAVVSSGVLLFSNHLPIIDALAEMEDRRRVATAVPMQLPPPIFNTVGNTAASAVPKFPSNTQPSPVVQSISPPPPPMTVTLVASAPSTWNFTPVTQVQGYTNLLRAFLVCSGAYFLGLIGGLVCSKLYAHKRRTQIDS